VAGKKKGNIYA